MSTPVRYIQTNVPYHIYNRGNRKSEIFLHQKDYLRFLDHIREYKQQYNVRIYCYCLMSNHFHLLASSSEESGLTTFMLRLSTSHAKYFNMKYHMVGRLFQERFRAKPVESDEYFLHLSRYIHLNPVSDDIETLTALYTKPYEESSNVRAALLEYPWSSYHEYRTESADICDIHTILNYFSKTHANLSYTNFVESSIPSESSPIVSNPWG